MTFAEKLSSLRKQANLTQSELADKLNVSRQAVTKWERGVGLPDIDNCKKLSSIFNISIDKLLDYKLEKIELDFDITKEKIDKKNYKCKNVINFVLNKFHDADSIYSLSCEPNWGFWKSFFYIMFDIDMILFLDYWLSHGLVKVFLIKKDSGQYIVSVEKDMLITRKLTESFDGKKLVFDGYKYKKLSKIK